MNMLEQPAANRGERGALWLIPSPISESEPLEVLPLSIKRTLERVNHYAVENEKSARRFIKRALPSKDQSALVLTVLNKYTPEEEWLEMLEPCFDGRDLGLISEAGCPGVADPGSELVELAHRSGIRVRPMVGPSSIVIALMGSGMNGQSFAFNGYLPIEKDERRKRVKEFEKLSRSSGQTQIFIETPYRNQKLFSELLLHLAPETRLCVAADLTGPSEYIRTLSAREWKASGLELAKVPALFLIDAR